MKAVAITQIVLLVLGILVVALVAYMLYTYFTTSEFDIAKCRAEGTRLCTDCKLRNWPDPCNQGEFADVGTRDGKCEKHMTALGIESIRIEDCPTFGIE